MSTGGGRQDVVIGLVYFDGDIDEPPREKIESPVKYCKRKNKIINHAAVIYLRQKERIAQMCFNT